MKSPKFTLKRLLIIVLIISLFFAAGELTKRSGRHQVKQQILELNDSVGDVQYEFPFVISDNSYFVDVGGNDSTVIEKNKRYYIWFFGYILKTSFSQDSIAEFEADVSVDEIVEQTFGQ